jgi:hypothetical protein
VMAARIRGVLGAEMVKAAPPLAFAFGAEPLRSEAIPSLANPPVAMTTTQPPDRWTPRRFDVTGPNVRTVDAHGTIQQPANGGAH